MKLEDRQSDNIEDRRAENDGDGQPSLQGMFGGSGSGGKLGLGTIVILAVVAYLIGIDPRTIIAGITMVNGGTLMPAAQSSYAPPAAASAPSPSLANDPTKRFVSSVLAETEDVWSQILPDQKNIRYVPPKLVLFTGATQSGCGEAEEAMGPFYCPEDHKVYLDTQFFDEMKQRFGGGGDFADAYVVAHEIGHHVQNLMGILPKVQEAQQRAGSKAAANAISVRTELMADCLAGVFAANADQRWHILEPGDVESAIKTAQAIGDDTLQKASRGYVVPDSFTHGTAEQRQQWLMTGLKSGKIDSCNTFTAQQN